MGKDYFIGDLHFGHRAVIRFDNRPFLTVDEMDEELIKRWNQKVTNKDTVYIMGDFSWYDSEKTREILFRLNGKKILIYGNHDKVMKKPRVREGLLDVFDYKELHYSDNTHLILCHYPIPCFNRAFHGAIMLYAHVHSNPEWKYLEGFRKDMEAIDIPCNIVNVGCMMPYMNYEPKTLNEILEGYKKWKEETHQLIP